MSVFPLRLSRAASVVGSLAGMALVFAAACGRDVTGTGGPHGVLVLLKPSFQSVNVNAGGDSVVALRVIISAFNSTAAATSARVIADITPNLDSLQNNGKSGTGGNKSDTVGVFKVAFPLQGSGFTYLVVLKAINVSRDTTYVGSTQFSTGDISASGAVTVSLRPVYVGPGSNAIRVVASPRAVFLTAFTNGLNSFALSAQAYDATGAALPKAFFNWGSLDTTIVGVDGNTGVVHALDKRGTTKVVVQAMGATNPQDTVVVSVTLPASAIVLVSGGGQTAATGHALANPIVVKAVAQDGVPVSGVTVNFNVQSGGSAVPAGAVTNSSGTASTVWTLGSNVGSQSLGVFTANAQGIQVPATATGGAGNGSGLQIAAVNGTPTTATHGSTVTITVLVTNNGQPAPNIAVSFVPATGAGSASPSPVNTDSQGHASTNWTLSSLISGQTLFISAPNANPNPLGLTLTSTAAAGDRLAPKPISP